LYKTDRMSISERLQMVIKMNGMTNASFADAIGVQRSSISHVLSGRNNPSVDFIQKILDTFPKVDANWLVAGRKVGRVSEVVTDPAPVLTDLVAESSVVEDEEPAPYNARPSVKAPVKEGTVRQVAKVVIFYNDGTYEEVGKG